MYIHTNIRTYVSMHVRTYVHTYVRTYIRTYVRCYLSSICILSSLKYSLNFQSYRLFLQTPWNKLKRNLAQQACRYLWTLVYNVLRSTGEHCAPSSTGASWTWERWCTTSTGADYTCTYVRMYVCTYVRMYIRTYVHMYVGLRPNVVT